MKLNREMFVKHCTEFVLIYHIFYSHATVVDRSILCIKQKANPNLGAV